ncbi:MAG: FAD-dependent oxidoreductase [Armatimonadota bacterium]
MAEESVSVEEQVPVAGDWDVIVCGGGPAGAAAAIAAGRRGRSVLLIEMHGRLGGLISNANIGTLCDTPGGPIFDEMIDRLEALGAASVLVNRERYYPPGRWRVHPGTTATLLMEMAHDAGVDLMLTTVVEGPLVKDDAVAGVFIANKAGRSVARAPVVIDCTADADVAARAGAAFVEGAADDGRIQHCNFRWGVEGINTGSLPPPGELEALCAEAVAAGAITPPDAIFGVDRDCFPFSRASGSLVLGGWELQHVDPTDPWQTTEATVQCQIAGLQIVRFLREHVPGCEDCRMRSAGIFTTRESRRIVGEYTVTGDDVLEGAKFDDGAVPAWFWLDLHDPAPGLSTPYTLEFVQANRPKPGDWYEIPYRCQVPREVDGLLVAGRCISCDHPAQGSLRVIPTCMYLGEVAGTAAAWAIADGIEPREVDGTRLKRELNEEYWTPPTYD